MECVFFLISMESQPQNPDFRNNHERFCPLHKMSHVTTESTIKHSSCLRISIKQANIRYK